METVSQEISKEQVEELTKKRDDTVKEVIVKLGKKDYNIFVYCPAMNSPSGGISVLFKHAKTLQDAGYNVTIVYEPQQNHKASLDATNKARTKGAKQPSIIFDKFTPDWLGELKENINMRCLAEGELKYSDGSKEKVEALMMNPEDLMIIPEGFPNVMENTSKLPCKRVVFAQSWYYILSGLKVGQKWQHFGIKDVISISDGITEYINTIMPGLNVKNYKQSIDRELFNVPKNLSEKSPLISYMPGRGQESQLKTSNVIRTFYEFFPHYRWVRFAALQGLSKEDFANQLKSSAIALYTDEIAGFGTLPLEAMACGTHVVGWTPFGSKEYINENNGFWAVNGDVFQLAELIGFALDRYFAGILDKKEVSDEYEKTLSEYSSEKENESILNIYKKITDERIIELKNIK
jgi:glycosyltransferase involved in cell wall biosynthesis